MDFQKRMATNADREDIEALVFSILKEYGLPPEPDGMDADLGNIETSYIRSGGAFWVVVSDVGRNVGTLGLAPLRKGVVELRKMYLASEVRGQGWGKRLLSEAIEEARRLGFYRIELETSSRLETAIRLYRSFGFQQVVMDHILPRCDQAFA